MQVLDATSLAERLRWEDQDYWLHLEAETPFDKYPAKQHARRVQEKMGIEHGLIYLPGQPARNNEDSDMPAPFRQRRYFYYLSGCNEPDCHMAYDVQRDVLTLFIPRINPARVIWNGRGSTRAEALTKYDIDQVFYTDELQYVIQEWAHVNRHAGVYVLHPSSRVPGCDNLVPRTDFHSLQPAMNMCRMIKDSHEISLIRKANDISSQAHREVLENILSFNNEAQVEGLFMDVCISRQAKQQAYDPIAASGPNAGTLHYDANNESFAGRQLMCLDAGCEYELYASDITRSFPLSSSWPSKEAKNVYKLVQRMQDTCIERLGPGVRYLDLHILAHQIAIDGLLQLGILHNGTKEEIYKAGTSRAFFPHGLGHHVGLEVHDPSQADLMSIRRGKLVTQQAPSLYPENFHSPVYNPETCRAPADPRSSHLEEGMVVTVEPGIYFSAYALQHFYLPSPVHSKFINTEALKRYLPVGGVRIEDDILITARGYENLTTAPKGKEMLEIIRQGRSKVKSPLDRTVAISQGKSKEVEVPLLRAPGIPKEILQLVQRPLTRSATLPADLKHKSVELEPWAEPSLLSNFGRSMTTEEKIEQWRKKHSSKPAPSSPTTTMRKATSVCGDNNPGMKHIYMGDASSMSSLPRTNPKSIDLSACKNCAILVQTLDRLRQNLASSAQGSPVPVAVTPQKDNILSPVLELGSKEIKVSTGTPSDTREHGGKKREELCSKPRSHPSLKSNQAEMQSATQHTQSGLSPKANASEEQLASCSPRPKDPATQPQPGPSTTVSPLSLPSPRPQHPGAEAVSEVEMVRRKLESLQSRLSHLEQRGQPTRPPIQRPSMPNLMSHNL
ncbi:hypothetical protein COCCADRAFT_29370 [Bipolaris zeicola 26-R-13]|uniref:Xaa-Pro aminopeptidase n=1 Tax=Cochliobolus carbonum (strain 26-R-13) TaxID=930089 RepID=W6Y396_COCC2|nr:uncharacterized protein COCCADRAFT_29370 [Bipolaris zeicola 26-R-13]EUC29584.1 hypothetical protein COCCADRAFT_29370 [Bipolaris zeicola 26-R-13]